MEYLARLFSLLRLMQRITADYGRGSRILLWFRMFMTIVQPRLPGSLRSAQKLQLSFEGKPFDLWMEDRTGLAAFEEVFVRGEYKADIPQARTIIDAGANIGVASVYLLLRYPDARLYAVEPNPSLIPTLRKNLDAFPRASVHECALSDIDGTVELHIHPSSSIASSLVARARGERIVRVISRTFDTFCNEQGIEGIGLLKFDIEGAEDKLLRAIHDLKKVRCYVGEIHPDLMDTSVEEIKSLFSGFSVTLEPIGSKRYVLTAIL